MNYRPEKPIIVQSDRSVLLEVHSPEFEAAREGLSRFAELETSPEHIHTYRITPISLWNAAAAGMDAEEMIGVLREFSKFEVPQSIEEEIRATVGRYGVIKMVQREGRLLLVSDDPLAIEEVWRAEKVRRLCAGRPAPGEIEVHPLQRGHVKQALIHHGFPVDDQAGYVEGRKLAFQLRTVTRKGEPFRLRPYQKDAVELFHAGGGAHGGSGVVVLPCGAGKTVVGIAAMEKLQCETLILASNVTAARQWIRELLDKTDLDESAVGEYTGEKKEVRPVTVTTYQTLTWRKRTDDDYPHLNLFNEKNWGLIIYDEVHLLPAEIFRVTAEIQAKRRLGLTATLVREDGREPDVFTLVGPKRYEVPWKVLERQDWIAEAVCYEVRFPMPYELRQAYAFAEPAEQFRIAVENPEKEKAVAALAQHHRGGRVLVIGSFTGSLARIAGLLGAPLITGKTPHQKRERLYESFRTGETPLLVVSRVANFAVDLPDANVCIEVSGMFGSRQEEAQRLGRILRPKKGANRAVFYTLVSRDTVEQEYARRRQRFLAEQGYRYLLMHVDDFLRQLKRAPAGIPPEPEVRRGHLRLVKG